MELSEMQRLKHLEDENRRLKQISDSTERVASLSIPSWNQIAGFLETMGAIRKIPVRGDYIASIAN